jgi:hypothetical protein
MSSKSHFLLSNLFEETHKELDSLNSEFNNLIQTYESQIDLDNDVEVKIEPVVKTEDKSLEDLDLQAENDSDASDDILSPTKIEIYRKIYMKEPIENEEDETETNKKKLKKDLDTQDDQSYLHKLTTRKCCKANCLNTKVNHNETLMKYRELRNYTKTQLDIFIMATMEALARNPGETTTGGHKEYHTSSYHFLGSKICRIAFLTIYGISIKKWDNIRDHYNRFGLMIKVHKLTNRLSNRAISFQVVLNILKFITNYASMHGLPSPG